MLFDDLQLQYLSLDFGRIQSLNGRFGPFRVLKDGLGFACRSVLFVPKDLAGMQVAIGGKEFLKVVLGDVIVKILYQDGSATLSETSKGRMTTTKSLLRFHERFPLESAAPVASFTSTALSHAPWTAAPSSAEFFLHLFILASM